MLTIKHFHFVNKVDCILVPGFLRGKIVLVHLLLGHFFTTCRMKETIRWYSQSAYCDQLSTFSGNGKRATIAASILKRHGFKEVEDSLGSMQACKNVGCEMKER